MSLIKQFLILILIFGVNSLIPPLPKPFESVYNCGSGSIFIPVYFGNPVERKQIRLDISTPYNYLSHNTNSTRLDRQSITFNNKILLSHQTFNQICLYDKSICKREMLFNEIATTKDFNKANNIYDSISFGLFNTFQNSSLIFFLLNSQFIKSPKFSFVPFDIESGDLYYGELPSIPEYKYKPKKYKCHNIDKKKWGCFLNKVIIDKINFTYIVNQKVFFTSISKYITTPDDFYMQIEKIVFNGKFNYDKCERVMEIYNEVKYFRCDCVSVKDFPSFVFVFNNYGFEMSTFISFEQVKDRQCNFIIKGKIGERLHWEFGTRFLNNYVTEYDYEDGSVTFYSKKYLQFYGNKFKFSNNIIIIICNIIFLSVSNIYLLYIKIYSTKK